MSTSTEYKGLTVVGSQPIYSIKLSLPSSLTMDDVTFSATFFVSKTHTITYQKSDMTRISSSEYTCKVDTTNMTRGMLCVEISATITQNSVTRTEKILIPSIDRLY